MHAAPRRATRLGTVLGLTALIIPVGLTVTTTEAAAKPQGPLADTIRGGAVMDHLERFQAIADRHGDRASGKRGYRASRNYVVRKLTRAGYEPEVQSFEFPFFEETGDAVLERTAPTAKTYVPEDEFATMTYSGSGDVTAPVQPVDIEAVEGTTSGCDAADFDGFEAGNIALVRRGGCGFNEMAANAEAAGAGALVVMNQGNSEDRSGVVQGTLGEPGTTIPAIGTSTAVGEELSAPGTEAHVVTDTQSDFRTTWNVVAETERGNRKNVVMAGAHLDSVNGGPGINDNGSGSAALLEVAEQLADRRAPRNKVRFAWWGAEELGLLGSEDYVADLAEESPRQLRRIALYLNFDMVASPNYALSVYDGDNSAFPVGDDAAEAPEGSAAIERAFHRFFDAYGTGSDETAFSGRSDYGPFIEQNVPAGGLFTGAEGVKTPEQAAQFGGTAGEAYDACYHEPCDDLGNVSRKALRANSKAIAFAVAKYARSTKSVNGNKTGHTPPPPAMERRSAARQPAQGDLHAHSHSYAAR